MGDQTEDVRAELEEVEERWSATIVANDAAAIAEFMAPEWVMVGEHGITKRSAFLEQVASGALSHHSMTCAIVRVQVAGNVAVVTARIANSGRFGTTEFSADEWTTDVFRRDDGHWTCVHTHATAAR